MANEPKSPITALAERLAQQPALKDNRVPVYAGRKAQARSTDARRIILFPHKATPQPGTSQPESLADFNQVMVAECWGRDVEETWALQTWLIQALQSQAEGTDEDPNDASSGPGYWWDLLGADWDVDPDTTTKGETVGVMFTIRLTVAAAPYDYGHLGNWPTGRIDSASQDVPESREVTNG
jgi:hypothetical protein